jgi:type IV pilus assembly protein PilO
MNLDKQQLIILGLGAAILCGFGVFQYIPVIRQNHAIRSGMQQQDQLSETIRSQSALLPELKQQEIELQQELVPFNTKVPQERRFAQFWQQIADVMNECKLTDQLVQPGQELKSDQLCSIPLTLECQGSLEQLFAFFQAMENMDRLIRFEEVKLENGTDLNAVVKLYAKASVYYQSESKGNGES